MPYQRACRLHWVRLTIIWSTLATVLGTSPAPAQPTAREPVVVRFSSLGGVTDAGLYLAVEHGLLAKAGIKLDMQRMTSVPTQVATLATGEIDVAGISLTPGLFAAAQRNIAIRIVGDKQSLQPGFSSTRLVVRSALAGADQAATVRALKGKTFAGPARASIGTYFTWLMLDRHGLSLADVRYIELGFPSMLAAFTNGALDAAVMIDPFLSQALASGVAKHLFDPIEKVPHGASVVPLIFGEKFAANRPLAQAFMDAYMAGVRLHNDAFVKGRDKERTIEIVARHAGIAAQVVRDGFLPALDPDQRVDKAFLKTVQAFFVQHEMLTAAADIDRLVDPSFAAEAVRRLGPYR